MTRAMTLSDIIGQLNQSSAQTIDLNPTEVVDEYIALNETAHAGQQFFAMSHNQMFVPYDVNIIQDGSPVGYWRLNEFGNYLSAVDQSFETGVGTWTAVVSTVAQSTTQHKDGTHSLQVSPTGAGAGAITGFYQLPVPGVTYGGSCWVFSTVASKTFTVTVNWYTAAQALISSSTSTAVTGTLNTWTQVPFTVAAPSNAAYFKLQVVATNSASGNTWYLDLVQITWVGYDSNPFALTLNFQKCPVSTLGTGTQLLNAQPGPYVYPDGSALPAGSTKLTTASDQMSIPNCSQLQIASDLSIELWLNTNGALSGSSANTYGLVSKSYAEYGLDIKGDGSLVFSASGGSQFVATSAAAIPNTNSWHHIVAVRKYSTRALTIYVDGVSKATASYTATPALTTNAVTIGKSSSNGALAGSLMAEVAIYGRPLTATQVTNHYNWAGYGTPPANQVPTGSGWGFSFINNGVNYPSWYGQYGFIQYPSYTYPTNTLYDGGALWGQFSWA